MGYIGEMSGDDRCILLEVPMLLYKARLHVCPQSFGLGCLATHGIFVVIHSSVA